MNPKINPESVLGTEKEGISHQQIDELLGGLLKEEEKAERLAKIMAQPETKAYYEKMKLFLQDAENTKAKLKQRVLPERSTPTGSFFAPVHMRFAFTMSIGVVCLLAFYLVSQKPYERTDLSQIQFKGGETPQIFIQQETPSGTIATTPLPAKVAQGDRLKFILSPASKYALILSVQEDGRVFNFLPSQDSQSIPLSAGAYQIELKGHMVIDDYKGNEKVIIIYSESPIPFAHAEKALSNFREMSDQWIRDKFKIYDIKKTVIHSISKRTK